MKESKRKLDNRTVAGERERKREKSGSGMMDIGLGSGQIFLDDSTSGSISGGRKRMRDGHLLNSFCFR